MATITSKTGARAWATATDWVGDALPADGDAVIIDANCQMLMNADLSLWTGLLTLTITSHATTPGMLYFKDATTGFLKFRTGTNYGIRGTNAAATCYDAETGGSAISGGVVASGSDGSYVFWADDGDYAVLTLFNVTVSKSGYTSMITPIAA